MNMTRCCVIIVIINYSKKKLLKMDETLAMICIKKTFVFIVSSGLYCGLHQIITSKSLLFYRYYLGCL